MQAIKYLGDKKRGLDHNNNQRVLKVKEYFYDVAAVAGVSHDNILRQCVNLANSPGRSVQDQMYEYYLIATIIVSDNNAKLLDAVQKHHYIRHTVALSKQMWSGSAADEYRLSESSQWHEMVIGSWCDCLERAASKNDETLAKEAIECGLLFILEKWCMVADEAEVIGTQSLFIRLRVIDSSVLRPLIGCRLVFLFQHPYPSNGL